MSPGILGNIYAEDNEPITNPHFSNGIGSGGSYTYACADEATGLDEHVLGINETALYELDDPLFTEESLEEAKKLLVDKVDEERKERLMGKWHAGFWDAKFKPDDLKCDFGFDPPYPVPKNPIPKQHMEYYKSILKFYKLAYPEFFDLGPIFDDPYGGMPIHAIIEDVEQRIKIKT